VGEAESPDRGPTARQALQNLALLLVSLLIVFAFTECGLRLSESGTIWRLVRERSLRIPHPVRGWTLEPGGAALWATRDRSALVEINEMGLRDRPHAHAADPGVFRIVVLGDSFMEAYQVDLEESLPHRLQESLASRHVEVINLGVGGYGTAQQYLYLRDEGLRYAPQLVLLAFFGSNDIKDNSRLVHQFFREKEMLKAIGRPFPVLPEGDAELQWDYPDFERLSRIRERKLERSSRFWNRVERQLEPYALGVRMDRFAALVRRRRTGRPEHDPNISFLSFVDEFLPELAGKGLTREDYEGIRAEAWSVTERLILETASLARANEAEFAVMLVPEDLQVEADFRKLVEEQNPGIRLDPSRTDRRIIALGEAAGFPVLHLAPIFTRAYVDEGRLLFHRLQDRHWNAAGHELAAAELAAFLDQRGLLPAMR
jgi:hypothetical protein